MIKEIPLVEDPIIWKKSCFSDIDFVEIHSNDKFDVAMQYPLLKMVNAEPRCLLRRDAYERLLIAASHLPSGYKICIWDAWRPFALQHEIFDVYSSNIIRDFGLESYPLDERNRFIAKFVSIPVEDRDVPPVHTTGGAIDVTLLDENGTELDMGTGFDAFTEKTVTHYFENTNDEVIKNNRRLLYSLMVDAGFTNLPSEWWHYDYGDRFYAYYHNESAIYRGVFSKNEIDTIIDAY